MVPIAVGSLLLALAEASAAPPPSIPWPAPASWSVLRLEARKAVFRGRVEIEARRLPAEEALPALREWPESGARKPDGEVVAFHLESRATFRGRSERDTWTDGRGLLQDEGREGRREAVRRFGHAGMHQWRQRGREPTEERRIELVPAGERPIVDLSVLLWLSSALRLDREGASLDVAVMSRGRLVPLDLRAQETASIRCPGGRSVTARRVLISSADPDVESALFGLRGNVDLWLDVATGMPVRLDGAVAKLGFVSVVVIEALPEETDRE